MDILSARERLIAVLEAIVSRDLVSPGDVVVETGLPRYMVLAFFQCLEALGVVETVYSKGNHKLYTSRPIARKLLEALRSGTENPIMALFVQQASQQASVDDAVQATA